MPITEAKRNFSRVARLVNQNGSAVILKEELADDEEVDRVAKRILAKNRYALEKLSK